MKSEKTMRTDAVRDYQMDNLKCLLIFAVVFGHLLELFMKGNQADKWLYLVIYSFHMPLFAYTTGVFARFQPEKIRKHIIYPYVVFQLLYLLFSSAVLQEEEPLQLTTPYWLMWYLFAVLVWNLLLPIVQAERTGTKLLLLAAAFLASILIGFDKKAGYYLSVSRIVQFFPYFLIGVYSRELRERVAALGSARQKKWMKRGLVLCAGISALTAALLFAGNVEEIKTIWLYGSCSYSLADYGWKFRAFYCLAALAWLGFFLGVMPKRKLPVLSVIGAHTMPIYLLHGFLIKYLDKREVFEELAYPEATALVMSAGILLLFSSGAVLKAASPLLSWPGRRMFGGIGARRITSLLH